MRQIIAVLILVTMAACTPAEKILQTKPDPLGNLDFGFAAVAAPNPTKGPVSRDATSEELVQAVDAAVTEHFERFDQGTKLYHIGVRVEGYVLARAGIPVVAAPKSAMIVNVTFFDDAKQAKLNEEPVQLTVLENVNGKTLLSSGLTQSKEQQLKNLAQNVAIAIEKHMRANEELFNGPADPATEG